MSQSNPVFKNAERASYELAYLLRDLPRQLDRVEPMTEEQHRMVDAADNHALNYTHTLLHGLESMGRVMWSAGANEQNPAETKDFAYLGMLVTELALQLQFLDEFRYQVSEYRRRQAQKGNHK